MVTVLPEIEQAPLAVMDAMVLALVVAETVKVELYAALAGAPVKVTVGGGGGVAYFALGHCHNPAIRAARTADAADATPPAFRGAWESDAFITLLRNAVTWGVGA